ncbi:MAG: hypothetical protein ACI8PZ_000794 [Myxococcota bacterium]|jgi:hypothetical protein
MVARIGRLGGYPVWARARTRTFPRYHPSKCTMGGSVEVVVDDAPSRLASEVALLRGELARTRRQTYVIVALGAVLLLGAASRPAGSVIRAQRIEVADDAGGRLVLQSTRGSPEILMTDPAGASLRLGIARGEPELALVAPGGAISAVTVDAAVAPDVVAAPVAAAPPPSPPPAPVDPATQVTVHLPPGQPYTGIEVRCQAGFRERASVTSGMATVAGLPPGDGCRVHFLGAAPKSVPAAAGLDIECTDRGGVLVCDPS